MKIKNDNLDEVEIMVNEKLVRIPGKATLEMEGNISSKLPKNVRLLSEEKIIREIDPYASEVTNLLNG